jgi:hypothetical protein
MNLKEIWCGVMDSIYLIQDTGPRLRWEDFIEMNLKEVECGAMD